MKKLLNLYFSPVEVFKQLSEKPDWVIPVIITLVIILILTMVALPKVIVPEQSKRIMEMEQLQEAQKERALASLVGIRPYIQTPISVIIFTFLLIFAKAGIFFLIFSLFGNRTVFKKVLAVVSYSFLISIPESILKTAMMLMKGSTRVYTSLALFASNLGFRSPLFGLLSRIDIFTIWNLILISLGFTVIYGIGKKKSFGIVFGCWILWILIQFGIRFILPKGLFFG